MAERPRRVRGAQVRQASAEHETVKDWWARVTAPIGVGDGTLPPFNHAAGEGENRRRAWRWEDWDGDAFVIDEYGCTWAETESHVQLSDRQWVEVAVVATHVAPIAARLRNDDGTEADDG
jgi:hypothetical protein